MGNRSIVGSLFVLIFSFLIVGCSNQNSDVSSNDTSLATTTSQSTTSNEIKSGESKKDYKDL